MAWPDLELSHECHGVRQEDQMLLSSKDASMFFSHSTESLNSSPQALV